MRKNNYIHMYTLHAYIHMYIHTYTAKGKRKQQTDVIS